VGQALSPANRFRHSFWWISGDEVSQHQGWFHAKAQRREEFVGVAGDFALRLGGFA